MTGTEILRCSTISHPMVTQETPSPSTDSVDESHSPNLWTMKFASIMQLAYRYVFILYMQYIFTFKIIYIYHVLYGATVDCSSLLLRSMIQSIQLRLFWMFMWKMKMTTTLCSLNRVIRYKQLLLDIDFSVTLH